MASQGGRGKKGVSLQVQQWVAEGHGAADIASLLKEQGYKKSRVSQLLGDLKREDKQAAGPASVNILCQRCGFPNCSCAACTQSMGKGSAKEKHQCWLHHYGAHPKTILEDPINNKRVPEDWVEARKKAWAEIAMDVELQWDGRSKSYHLVSPTGCMEGQRQRKRQKIPQEAAGAEPAGELQMASEAAAEDL